MPLKGFMHGFSVGSLFGLTLLSGYYILYMIRREATYNKTLMYRESKWFLLILNNLILVVRRFLIGLRMLPVVIVRLTS